MCGIAGVVRFDAADPEDEGRTARLAYALAHRGPDGEGRYRSRDGRAWLVHRRLAIIDPTARAAQPMASADGRFRIVFNGEIYNYAALRRDLQERGVPLRTSSDTEVLLHLLRLEGPEALVRARGMFALAFWDEWSGELLVARDRFGMKPLYVAADRKHVVFASELDALRRAGLVEPRVSAAGVLAYLRWGSIPAPLTWIDGVEQLEPGTWRRWTRGGAARAGSFADARVPYIAGEDPRDDDDFRERAREAIRDTVRAHLVADVPVGLFLSGGIDSGAIATTARAVSTADLHTYTVIVDEDAYSEEALARTVAERLGTTHHTLRVDAHGIERDLDTIVGRLDAPTGDAVNSYYVSQAVAATGVKAVLSGVGGDEMFGGYPSFTRIPAAMAVSKTLGPIVRATGGVATLAMPAWRASKWRQFAGSQELESAYRALRGFFMPNEIAAIAGPALDEQARFAAGMQVDDAERDVFEPIGEETVAASVARMEVRGYLRSQLLRDIDAVSMAHGLEVRMPFVDHRLQASIWPSLGRYPRLLEGKRLLHESLDRPLPDDVVRSPKRGFTLPFAAWMRGPLREPARAGLAALADRGWISRAASDSVWSDWERGQAHWSRPWGLSVLGRFLERAA
jgi:asparagine synthase (glutamine-hydrolysing)